MIDRSKWTGGYHYLLNLCRILSSHPEQGIVFNLYAGKDVPEKDTLPFSEIPNVYVVRDETFSTKWGRERLTRALFRGVDMNSANIFADHGIDVVFEVASYFGWRFPVPVIGWLPDFQHRHLPKLFSPAAFIKREVGFRAQLHTRQVLMVSSYNALKDCKRFYRWISRKIIRVVPFTVRIDTMSRRLDPDRVRTFYGLPKGFFYLPNQFWKHKNHRVVIQALHRIRQTDIVVAASGNTNDSRHSGHFYEVKRLVNSLGMENRFRLLGLVPYRELIALMRASRAVINPSLFEGWSTTVEEARTLGVPLILSDIPVHREQMGARAQYFPAQDVTALSLILMEENSKPIPDRYVREMCATEEAAVREKAFAVAFGRLVETACST